MAIPDEKYLPKAKVKSKPKKIKNLNNSKSFPAPLKKIETRPLKKKSPFGDHYVWSK